MNEFTNRAILLIFMAMLVAPVSMLAQEDSPIEADFDERVTVSYVVVPFSLFDRRGKPVANLERRDFELLVEGAPVETDLFEKSHDAPVSFTILLDGSGSMGLGNKIAGARQALRSLIARARPGDDFALWVFSGGEVNPVVPFTSDGQRILTAVDGVEPFGKTALYDAIVQMPDQTILGTNGVRAIILLTDGLENHSKIDAQTLRRTLEGVSVPVYPFGLQTEESLRAEMENDTEATMDLAALASLAGASGGRLAVAAEPKALDVAIREVLKELRAQYIVGFTPTGEDGVRFRSVSLDLKRPVGFVRIRAGYKGSAPRYK